MTDSQKAGRAAQKAERAVKASEVRDDKVRDLLARQMFVLVYIAVIVSIALLVAAVK